MNETLEQIYSTQLAWAASRGIKTENGYTLTLEDNLFQPPLSAETKKEFTAGKGAELEADNLGCKMQALHSSSALVVNFFEYWRKTNKVSIIARACGSVDKLDVMHFEATHTNPAARIRPHLDLEFSSFQGGKTLAIEAKFTEVYHRMTKRQLAPVYLRKREIWSGLPGCEELARRIEKEQTGKSSFQYLDVPQILKHILGLQTDCGKKGFTLLYLWYGVSGDETDRHWEEIVELQSYLKGEVDFQTMTYQDLFSRLKHVKGIDREYSAYLESRYFQQNYSSLYDNLVALKTKYGCQG